MSTGEVVLGIEQTYQAAVNAEGRAKFDLFHHLHKLFNDFAIAFLIPALPDREHIYRRLFNKHTHDFNGAVCGVGGLYWRLAEGVYTRPGKEEYTVTEIEMLIQERFVVMADEGQRVINVIKLFTKPLEVAAA